MRKHINILYILTAAIAAIIIFSICPPNPFFAAENLVTWLVRPTLEFYYVDPAGFAFDGYARVAVPDESAAEGFRWIYINEKGEQQIGYTDIEVKGNDAMRLAKAVSQKPDYLDNNHIMMQYFGYDTELTPECNKPEDPRDMKCGYKDKTGKLVIAAEYGIASFFRNGFARVSKWEGNEIKYGFIDKTGKVAVPLIYTGASSYFNDGLAGVVGDNRRWGFVDETGAVVIPFMYSGASQHDTRSLAIGYEGNSIQFSDGLCVVSMGLGYDAVINKNGAVVFSDDAKDVGYTEITNIVNNLALVRNLEFKWGIVKFDAAAANYKPPATVASDAKPAVSSPAVNKAPATKTTSVGQDEGTQITKTKTGQQTMNNDSVIKLIQAGFSEDIIVSTINASPGDYDTSVDAIIALKMAGVGDKALAAIVEKTKNR